MTATIQSACECQARLGAQLDENRQVLGAWAVERRRGTRLTAPALSMGTQAPRFQVGWACPVCGRNTLRSFDNAALVWSADP